MTTSNSAGALRTVSSQTQSAPTSEEELPHNLPAEPLVVVEPGAAGVGAGLRELWAYRELLYFLTWRDVKVRYKQTLLGVLWAVLQPLFMMLIFTLFFGTLANMPADGIPYPLFTYAALLPWLFFSNTVTAAGNSLINNSHLITKVYFPRALIPVSAVGAGLVDLGIAFAILVVLMIYYGVPLSAGLLMLVPLVALTTLLAVGVGMWLASVNVKYRDVRHALPFIMQLWMFASPVIYPTSLTQGKLRWALTLNPMTGIIEGYRGALFAQKGFDWAALGTAAAITLIWLAYSVRAFRRMERDFADLV